MLIPLAIVESYLYPVKEGQRYINLKRERGREAHLNYYASTHNRLRNTTITPQD